MKQFFMVISIMLCLAGISTAGGLNNEKAEHSENEKISEKKFIIELKNDLISADIENIPLGDVLQEIVKKTGIKINISDKSVSKRIITVNFKNMLIEDSLKTILGGNYVFTFTKSQNDKKKYVLTEVGIVNKSLKPVNRILTKEITYGSGKENIGSIRAGEGANSGPTSFTIDSHGNIFICDTVNRRIQILSPDGNYLSSIQLIGQMPEDISIDKNGFIYVYDVGGKLYQYSAKGDLVGELRIDESRWDSRGPMHIIDNEIYVRGSGIGDVLIAKTDNGKLTLPSAEEVKNPLEDGIYGVSGKRYIAFLEEKKQEGGVEVVERDGSKTSRFIPLADIVSVEFVGEDGKGNSYVKTEGGIDGKLVVEVSKFNANGDYVNTIPIPVKDYNFWTIKTVSVGEDGSVYQMMPGKDRVTFNSFLSN